LEKFDLGGSSWLEKKAQDKPDKYEKFKCIIHFCLNLKKHKKITNIWLQMKYKIIYFVQ